MSLIIQCWYCTEENGKFKYAKKCVESLMETVDLSKHRLVIINQNSCAEAKEFLSWLANKQGITVVNLSENIGTARGINIGLRMREPGEMCIKCDDDLTWESKGWVEELEAVIKKRPDIGILGLKRDDIWQKPGHENPAYRTKMDGMVEICPDIMGTCTAYNPLMLDKVGFLSQPSNYGFDDSIISVRSIAAGFINGFLPHIKIVNLDEGGTEYTAWKIKEAGVYLTEACEYMDLIKDGTIPYYYDGE